MLFTLFFGIPVHAQWVNVEYNFYDMQYGGQLCQTGWIKGYDTNYNQLWYYQCDFHPRAQSDSISWIGINDGKVYFFEDGAIIALDLASGYQVWKNTDYKGTAPAKNGYTFSSSGKLYICGYFRPDLFIVDSNGTTISRVFSLTGYSNYWPYKLEFTTGDNMKIWYESNNSTYEFNVLDYFNKIER